MQMFNVEPEFDMLVDGEMAVKFPDAFLWRAQRRAELLVQLKKERADREAKIGRCFPMGATAIEELPTGED